jgi:regulator of sigma E protease
MGDVIRATALNAGEDVVYRIRRGGEELILTARPREVVERNDAFGMVEKVGRVGLGLEHVNLHLERAGPIAAMDFGISSTVDAILSTINVLRRLVSGLDGLDKMSGPVGILNLSDNVTDIHMKQEGVPLSQRLAEVTLRLIELAALFSIGVGFFNLLPIPMLDGWAAILCAAEAATGRATPEVVHRVGLTIGLACLVSFTLLVTWNDLTRPGGPLEVLSGMLS